MSNDINLTEETAACNKLLSLETLLISRLYLYTLFHKAFGGKPSPHLLKSMASQMAINVVDEYADTNEIMAKIKLFFAQQAEKAEDKHYLDNITSEYTRFFQGPENLSAYPWEAPYISHDETVFQKSTLVVRNTYRTYGLQVKKYKCVPDDHISIMCTFLSLLARKSLNTFRSGLIDDFRLLFTDQYSFIHNHMNNWLPEYAELACREKSAYLYPQLAKGIEAFAKIDENFAAQVLNWIDSSCSETKVLPVYLLQERPAPFNKLEKAIEELEALKLFGIEENELIAII